MTTPDKEDLKRQWLHLIDHYGEDRIRQQLNKGSKISDLRKKLQQALPPTQSNILDFGDVPNRS